MEGLELEWLVITYSSYFFHFDRSAQTKSGVDVVGMAEEDLTLSLLWSS